MIYTLLAILASVPIGIAINLITPWVKTQVAMHSRNRRRSRIKAIHEQFQYIQDLHTGKLTNVLIAWATDALIRIIMTGLGAVSGEVGRLIFTFQAEYKLSGTPVLWTFSPKSTPAVLTFMQACTFACTMACAYQIMRAVKLINRIRCDKSFDDFKRLTDRNLAKLGGSLVSDVDESCRGESKSEVQELAKQG